MEVASIWGNSIASKISGIIKFTLKIHFESRKPCLYKKLNSASTRKNIQNKFKKMEIVVIYGQIVNVQVQVPHVELQVNGCTINILYFFSKYFI